MTKKPMPPANRVPYCPPHLKHFETDGSGRWRCIKPGCGATGIDRKSIIDPEDAQSRYKQKMSEGGRKGRAAATKAIRARAKISSRKRGILI
jgi:hypothetical protein